MPTIEWVGTPNYRAGRSGRKPIAIVNHITAGAYPGCLTWMQNPKARASAHYLITKTGKILQLVKDEDTAWHAGEVRQPSWPLYDGTNPNQYTIGIEHENLGGGELTEEQYQATLWLHRQLVSKWNIPVDKDHIIGHYRIDSVNRPNCPGPKFPWERLFTDLKGGKKVQYGILLYNHADYEPAKRLCEMYDFECAIFIRKPKPDGTRIPPNIIHSVETLFRVGGGPSGHKNEIPLSGDNWFKTVMEVGKHMKKL